MIGWDPAAMRRRADRGEKGPGSSRAFTSPRAGSPREVLSPGTRPEVPRPGVAARVGAVVKN